MSDETKNAFERKAAQPTLADDRKKCFDRHQEVVDAAKRDTTAYNSRVAKHEQCNALWTHRNSAPKASGGTPLTPDLAALKANERAFTAAQKQPTNTTVPFIAPTVETITAIVNGWKTQTPNGRAYFDSAFNHRNMTLRVREQFELGNLVQWSVEVLDETYFFLLVNNYLETPFKTASIHPRGQPAPKPYPYVMPEEAAEETERERIEDSAKTAQEIERALSLPFNELQKQVRQDFQSAAAGVENIGERVR